MKRPRKTERIIFPHLPGPYKNPLDLPLSVCDWYLVARKRSCSSGAPSKFYPFLPNLLNNDMVELRSSEAMLDIGGSPTKLDSMPRASIQLRESTIKSEKFKWTRGSAVLEHTGIDPGKSTSTKSSSLLSITLGSTPHASVVRTIVVSARFLEALRQIRLPRGLRRNLRNLSPRSPRALTP